MESVPLVAMLVAPPAALLMAPSLASVTSWAEPAVWSPMIRAREMPDAAVSERAPVTLMVAAAAMSKRPAARFTPSVAALRLCSSVVLAAAAVRSKVPPTCTVLIVTPGVPEAAAAVLRSSQASPVTIRLLTVAASIPSALPWLPRLPAVMVRLPATRLACWPRPVTPCAPAWMVSAPMAARLPSVVAPAAVSSRLRAAATAASLAIVRPPLPTVSVASRPAVAVPFSCNRALAAVLTVRSCPAERMASVRSVAPLKPATTRLRLPPALRVPTLPAVTLMSPAWVLPWSAASARRVTARSVALARATLPAVMILAVSPGRRSVSAPALLATLMAPATAWTRPSAMSPVALRATPAARLVPLAVLLSTRSPAMAMPPPVTPMAMPWATMSAFSTAPPPLTVSAKASRTATVPSVAWVAVTASVAAPSVALNASMATAPWLAMSSSRSPLVAVAALTWPAFSRKASPALPMLPAWSVTAPVPTRLSVLPPSWSSSAPPMVSVAARLPAFTWLMRASPPTLMTSGPVAAVARPAAAMVKSPVVPRSRLAPVTAPVSSSVPPARSTAAPLASSDAMVRALASVTRTSAPVTLSVARSLPALVSVTAWRARPLMAVMVRLSCATSAAVWLTAPARCSTPAPPMLSAPRLSAPPVVRLSEPARLPSSVSAVLSSSSRLCTCSRWTLPNALPTLPSCASPGVASRSVAMSRLVPPSWLTPPPAVRVAVPETVMLPRRRLSASSSVRPDATPESAPPRVTPPSRVTVSPLAFTVRSPATARVPLCITAPPAPSNRSPPMLSVPRATAPPAVTWAPWSTAPSRATPLASRRVSVSAATSRTVAKSLPTLPRVTAWLRWPPPLPVWASTVSVPPTKTVVSAACVTAPAAVRLRSPPMPTLPSDNAWLFASTTGPAPASATLPASRLVPFSVMAPVVAEKLALPATASGALSAMPPLLVPTARSPLSDNPARVTRPPAARESPRAAPESMSPVLSVSRASRTASSTTVVNRLPRPCSVTSCAAPFASARSRSTAPAASWMALPVAWPMAPATFSETSPEAVTLPSVSAPRVTSRTACAPAMLSAPPKLLLPVSVMAPVASSVAVPVMVSAPSWLIAPAAAVAESVPAPAMPARTRSVPATAVTLPAWPTASRSAAASRTLALPADWMVTPWPKRLPAAFSTTSKLLSETVVAPPMCRAPLPCKVPAAVSASVPLAVMVPSVIALVSVRLTLRAASTLTAPTKSLAPVSTTSAPPAFRPVVPVTANGPVPPMPVAVASSVPPTVVAPKPSVPPAVRPRAPAMWPEMVRLPASISVTSCAETTATPPAKWLALLSSTASLPPRVSVVSPATATVAVSVSVPPAMMPSVPPTAAPARTSAPPVVRLALPSAARVAARSLRSRRLNAAPVATRVWKSLPASASVML